MITNEIPSSVVDSVSNKPDEFHKLSWGQVSQTSEVWTTQENIRYVT